MDKDKDKDKAGLICVGVVTSVHGVKGEVKITLYSSDEVFESQQFLSDKKGNLYKIDIRSRAGNKIIAMVNDIKDRTSAESLRGTELFIKREALPATGEDEFYYEDLYGLDVIYQGELFGSVKAVHNFGAGDLLEIIPKGKMDGEFFSFTREMFPIVDVAKGFVEINIPEKIFMKEGEEE